MSGMNNNLTFVTTESISAGDMIELDALGYAEKASTETTTFVGVAITDKAAEDELAVQTQGVVTLTASAAIAPGTKVMVDSSDATKIEAADAYNKVIGIATEKAAADGDEIEVLLK